MGWLWLALALAAGAPEADMDLDQPLRTLRAGHPRLILLDDDLPRLREQIAAHETAARWHRELTARAARLLAEPPTEYRIVGPRLLGASRSVLDRIYTLAFLYRLDGNEAFGRRAVAELAAAAAWPQWNPSHFLDVAELNHAFGIGWDWLQPLLGDDRAAIREALLTKGLGEALKGYRAEAWWGRNNHNWNQVCNGGNSIGALALADEEPELAAEILSQAVRLLPRAMNSYAPDGGWAEGPGYWHYATRYNVYVLAAMETALGGDFGLSDITGFSAAGDFRLHFVGPSGQTFNYADAGSGAEGAEEMFWLARRFDNPLYAWQQRQLGRGHALDLIWFSPDGNDPDAAGVPLDSLFTGVQVAFLRGSWADPDTTWLALKGGDNRANHSHLDLGTFVLDALGERWIFELGTDNYNLPGYFGNQRWNYYRLNTQGQNTLQVNGENQNPAAKAPIVAFGSAPERAEVVADLSAGYPMCRQVRRGAALLGRRDVLIVDEVEADEPVELLWHAHTRAECAVDGARVTLNLAGKQLHGRILSPAGAVFEARSAAQEPPQNANEGVTRLTIVLPERVTETRLAVLFSPAAEAAEPAVEPLADWLARSGR